ncbi:response regulator transcription factor [Nocardioides cynanchi]|uniref:response regulator transcription factor n=1 Tax=Nocardioides cynanchi TaxID=2558918 RepID=UPI001246539D|nr:response regulator transcription factor [Nocardioides cynanchi]
MRLLVVEDEARLARALERGLVADGFTVDLAADGVSGLEAARDGQYDAVLLDVMLPGLSGYEVVKRLRAEENWVPVMMVSAKDGPYDQADGLDYGADDYLTKPFDYVVLLARLRALLRRQSDPRPPVLTHADVRLDPATREVTLAGVPVALSPREYELLEFFLRHQDRVVTKIELLDRVWDARGVGYDPNTVEVYVGYLRRKLGAGVIETVRGAGYRLSR